jgi:hypothetical protein
MRSSPFPASRRLASHGIGVAISKGEPLGLFGRQGGLASNHHIAEPLALNASLGRKASDYVD